MRDYSIPALAEIADNASLADVVFRRAKGEPASTVIRRRSAAGGWQDVTAQQFRC